MNIVDDHRFELNSHLYIITMNRLEEGRIRTIGSSFYKNVLLLTQMQPPFIEFQRYFRQVRKDKFLLINFC